MVTVRFFASLRDIVGEGLMEIDVRGATTVETLFEELAARFPRLGDFRGSLLIAVNQEYSHWSGEVRGGDEVAFFPPVSGG